MPFRRNLVLNYSGTERSNCPQTADRIASNKQHNKAQIAKYLKEGKIYRQSWSTCPIANKSMMHSSTRRSQGFEIASGSSLNSWPSSGISILHYPKNQVSQRQNGQQLIKKGSSTNSRPNNQQNREPTHHTGSRQPSTYRRRQEDQASDWSPSPVGSIAIPTSGWLTMNDQNL